MAKNVHQGITVVGLNETLRAFSKYGKDANKELRQAAREIAQRTATQAVNRAGSVSKLTNLVAVSVNARSDRVPKIVSGGSRKIGKNRAPAGALFFGAEFGGGARAHTRQFAPHLGRTGYFLWPTIRRRSQEDLRIYNQALNDIGRKWARGG